MVHMVINANPIAHAMGEIGIAGAGIWPTFHPLRSRQGQRSLRLHPACAVEERRRQVDQDPPKMIQTIAEAKEAGVREERALGTCL